MPYYQTTLSNFITQISQLMDDETQVYWTVPEIQSVVYEGMRVWGAMANYWRARGSFSLVPTQNSPYYDLSVQLPDLRSRTWTLQQMVKDIQYMLLENPSGIAGTGMSGQVTVQSILTAIQIARNRFVLDTHLPLSVHAIAAAPPPPTGMITYDQATVFVHRAAWQDATSLTWTNLWRDDAWGIDKSAPLWPIEPGDPQVYSEAEVSPLQLQLMPPPIRNGLVEVLSVDSLIMDITNPASLFGVPDEWVHAIKYSALSYILAGEGQIKDMTRAQYAEHRYQQSVEMAKEARSMLRMLFNGVPLSIDSLDNLDAGQYTWRNQVGPPENCGVLYDIVAVNPGSPDQAYGMGVDVVAVAPLPNLGDPSPDNPNVFIQMGPEELDHLSDYVTHVLSFKCGGNDFKSSYSGYDNFMEAISRRKGANAAKIKYLVPLFGQPQKEWEQRPDRITAGGNDAAS